EYIYKLVTWASPFPTMHKPSHLQRSKSTLNPTMGCTHRWVSITLPGLIGSSTTTLILNIVKRKRSKICLVKALNPRIHLSSSPNSGSHGKMHGCGSLGCT